MKIAICDDSKIILDYMSEKIKGIFLHQKCDVSIKKFNSSKDLVRSLVNEFFDVVFLDVDMPNFSGFDVAKKIQHSMVSSTIIFISNLESSVYESIQFQPFRFIRKSYFDEEIFNVIEALVKKSKHFNDNVLIKLPSERIRLYPHKIIYIECNDKILKIISCSEIIELRYRLKDMEMQLRKYGFIRIHKGYLVNSQYIHRINKSGEVLLKSGQILPVSKRRVKEVFEIIGRLVM